LRLVKVVGEWPGATLVPPVSLKLNLDAPVTQARNLNPVREDKVREEKGHRPGRRAPAKPAAAPSWWTARATAGEVTGGFTKEEILRRPEADPRAEGGMFARIEGLLRALS
jgi:hypothetical protein